MVNKKIGYSIFMHIIMIILCILCLAPFLLLISASLSSESSLISGGYSFIPKEVSFEAYKYLLQAQNIFYAYGMSLLVTVIGTTASILVTTLVAYPLSLSELPGRRIINFLVFFTMLFSGGLVPSYMMWTQLFHIKNTIWAYVLPNLVTNGFTIMVMRSYFITNIPRELLESARVDGASEFYTLFKIVMPISLPIMATIGLMSGITYWNDWTNGLYYNTDKSLNTVQVLLNNMLTNAQFIQQMSASSSSSMTSIPTTAVRMAVAVAGALPLMCIYPFFQKYFVKGLTIGAVKG